MMKLIKLQKIKNYLNTGFILGLFGVISLIFILQFGAIPSLLILAPLVAVAIAARAIIAILELKLQKKTLKDLEKREKGCAEETGRMIHPKSLYC